MNKKEFSKNCLSQALIELLEEHEYQDISIQDIVDKAGFSRMAYYRNFKEKSEVLEFYVHNIFSTFVKEKNLTFKYMGPEKFYSTLFNFFSSEAIVKMTRLFIKRNLVGYLYNEFIKLNHGGFVPNQSDYFYSYIAGGFFAVLLTWVKNGLKESPEEMAAEATRVTNTLMNKVNQADQ